jgi:hypothetical protein
LREVPRKRHSRGRALPASPVPGCWGRILLWSDRLSLSPLAPLTAVRVARPGRGRHRFRPARRLLRDPQTRRGRHRAKRSPSRGAKPRDSAGCRQGVLRSSPEPAARQLQEDRHWPAQAWLEAPVRACSRRFGAAGSDDPRAAAARSASRRRLRLGPGNSSPRWLSNVEASAGGLWPKRWATPIRGRLDGYNSVTVRAPVFGFFCWEYTLNPSPCFTPRMFISPFFTL